MQGQKFEWYCGGRWFLFLFLFLVLPGIESLSSINRTVNVFVFESFGTGAGLYCGPLGFTSCFADATLRRRCFLFFSSLKIVLYGPQPSARRRLFFCPLLDCNHFGPDRSIYRAPMRNACRFQRYHTEAFL